jgi:hypothetical protein
MTSSWLLMCIYIYIYIENIVYENPDRGLGWTLRASLDGCGKSHSQRDSIPGPYSL